MNLLTTLKNFFRPTRRPFRADFLAGQRARTTVDDESILNRTPRVSSPFSPMESWRVEDLNDKTLARISAGRLVELLADVSPEVSKALWDFILFCNPGYTITALRPGSDEQDDRATAVLKATIVRLDELQNSSFDTILNKYFLGIFCRGALFTEAVFDDAGVELLDLATPDPGSARFEERYDTERGQYWQLGQIQGGQFVALESETVRYLPVHPWPGKAPYGRAPILPALPSALFILGLMHDLRRVIAQQGYPRLDLEIDLEQLQDSLPVDLSDDPDTWKNWINEMIEEVKTVYAALEPDDAFIHTSAIKINRPVGTVNADSLGAIGGIIEALERMITRGLKTIPLLMATNQSTTETQANRQWETYLSSIKSIQQMAETVIDDLFGLALEAQGIQAVVQFRLAELRASERLRDAQAKAMEIANARAKYGAGWVSQDAASEEVTSSPADVDTPRAAPASVEIVEDDGDGAEADSEARAGQVGEVGAIAMGANGR